MRLPSNGEDRQQSPDLARRYERDHGSGRRRRQRGDFDECTRSGDGASAVIRNSGRRRYLLHRPRPTMH